MFGEYTTTSARQISAERTARVKQTVRNQGGEVKGIYALLGEHDLALIVELPRMADAMRLSLELKKLTEINFFTVAALPIEEFDTLFEG